MSPGPRRRVVALALVVVMLVAFGAASAVFPRQIRAYLTHWKGSPTGTQAYVPPAGTPMLRVAVAGDVGESVDRLRRTAAAMVQAGGAEGLDVLLLLGDNVYPSGDPARLDEFVFGPFAGVLEAGAKLLAIVGNHDVKEGHGPAQMQALGMPGLWWAEEINETLFVGLDSNQADNAEQASWLETTLAASQARWTIVAVHHPPYSAGYQGSSQDVRRAFSPLFEKHGVDLVLSGHDHDYQRSEVIGGVTYIVTGGAASTRRTSSRDFTAASFSWHHFVELDIWPDRIDGEAVNQSMRVADAWSIPRQP